MDSLTHRLSSSKCPVTKQRQRTATKIVIGTTVVCSTPRLSAYSQTAIFHFTPPSALTQILSAAIDTVHALRERWLLREEERRKTERGETIFAREKGIEWFQLLVTRGNCSSSDPYVSITLLALHACLDAWIAPIYLSVVPIKLLFATSLHLFILIK